ncbi:hypothetical protein LMG22037_03685 [Paraburkholderia phenoliruptrix]|uniref:Uncharacterized protein n=1 Tax=Paraburkholderia phenoliruptrix TaxID=252970 RepID=A0A6J5BFX1_9BURK|nr:hypothetical protein LMG22037_03685 [Paraburkholderia phenoliruptrix]
MSAVRFRLSLLLVVVILPFSWMLPLASIVRFALPPAVLTISAPACCTILPVAVPELAVVIVTSVPAFSALLMVVFLTVAVVFVPPLNVPPDTLPLYPASVPVLIVTSVGSISH